MPWDIAMRAESQLFGSDVKDLAILMAARRHFFAKGFRGASMDRIASSARVSKATVYAKFGGKKELFAAMLLRAPPATQDDHTILEMLSLSPEVELKVVGVQVARLLQRSSTIAFFKLLLEARTVCPEAGRAALLSAIGEYAPWLRRVLLRIPSEVEPSAEFLDHAVEIIFGSFIWHPAMLLMLSNGSVGSRAREQRFLNQAINTFMHGHSRALQLARDSTASH